MCVCARVRACAHVWWYPCIIVYVWRTENNWQASVLFFTLWIPGFKLRFSGLVESAFPHWAILLVPLFWFYSFWSIGLVHSIGFDIGNSLQTYHAYAIQRKFIPCTSLILIAHSTNYEWPSVHLPCSSERPVDWSEVGLRFLCTYRSTVGCLPLSLSTLFFETGSLTVSEAYHFC